MIHKLFFIIICLFILPFSLQAQPNQEPVHTVQPGETLFGIARQYEVSVQELREWNRLPDHAIIPGQRLFIRIDTDEATSLRDTPADTLVHTVEPGQTLFRISRMYGVPVEDILKQNNLESPVLSIGQELAIVQKGPELRTHTETETVPPPEQPDVVAEKDDPLEDDDTFVQPSYTYYEIRPGDTLTRIAAQFQMSIEELMELNHMEDSHLRAGDQLRIRSRSPVAPSIAVDWDIESTPQGKFVNYQIKQNDDIGQLMRYHQMDRHEFRSLNPGRSISNLRPGDEVTLLLAATSVQQNPYLIQRSSESEGDLIQITRYPDYRAGTPTTSGELYNPESLTAAHPALPLGTVVFISNPETGHGIYVLINDRTSNNRVTLSKAAFRALHFSEASGLQAEISLLPG